MRLFLALWAAPMALLWGWFGLSYYDFNFGTLFLSRRMHDLVFMIYGNILGMDPATIPGLLAKACLLDTALLMGIIGFRRRKQIRAWWDARKAGAQSPEPEAAELPTA